MNSNDKFLLGIVVFILLVVGITFVLVLTQSEPAYQSDHTPEGVVYNYLLALKEGDYERALDYISPCVKNRPGSAEAFARTVNKERYWDFRNLDRDTSLTISSVTGGNKYASVSVLETIFRSNNVLDASVNHNEFEMKLTQQDKEWKLIDGEDYWSEGWVLDYDCP
jgi:hypothetical protein